jgi:hypothetical protein
MGRKKEGEKKRKLTNEGNEDKIIKKEADTKKEEKMEAKKKGNKLKKK